MNWYFDLETCSQPDAQLELVRPEFTAPANWKDESKIAAYKVEAFEKWKQNAALSAVTAQILCIGFIEPLGEFEVLEGSEAEIINGFWMRWNAGGKFIGFAIKLFDLGMIVRRGWVHDIRPPQDAMEGRYWSSRFIDLMEQYSCGHREQAESLDTVAKTLGIGAKNGDGKDFAALWATDKEKAKAYLHNDCLLVSKLAKRMGFE